MIKITRKRESVSQYNEGENPQMVLHRLGRLHLVRFNKAFYNAAGINDAFRVDFFYHGGKMLIRKSETGEFMVRPTTVAFVYGFNSKDIHDKASKLFGKIGRMKYYNLVRVQIGALQYWEAKLCQ